MATAFRGIIEFIDRIGIYDVVLPFILVFTLVFAILEKTKVLGTETIDGKKWSKKNLNAIIAFSISFFVVGSSKLVEILQIVSSYTVILLMVSILFLLLVGSFWKEGEGVFLSGKWNSFFMIIMFIGIVFIFLNAIKTDSNETWLAFGWEWLVDHWQNEWVATIIFIVIIYGIMRFITKEEKGKPSTASIEKK